MSVKLSFFVDPAAIDPSGAHKHFGEITTVPATGTAPAKSRFRVRTELKNRVAGSGVGYIETELKSVSNVDFIKIVFNNELYVIGKVGDFSVNTDDNVRLYPYYDLSYIIYKTNIDNESGHLLSIPLKSISGTPSINYICQLFEQDIINHPPYQVKTGETIFVSHELDEYITLTCLVSHYDLHKIEWVYTSTLEVDKLSDSMTNAERAKSLSLMDDLLSFVPSHTLFVDTVQYAKLYKYNDNSNYYTTNDFFLNVLSVCYNSVVNKVYLYIYDQGLFSTQQFSNVLINKDAKILLHNNNFYSTEVRDSQWPIAIFDLSGVVPTTLQDLTLSGGKGHPVMFSIHAENCSQNEIGGLVESSNILYYSSDGQLVKDNSDYYKYPILNSAEIKYEDSSLIKPNLIIGVNGSGMQSVNKSRIQLAISAICISSTNVCQYLTCLTRVQIYRNNKNLTFTDRVTIYQAKLSVLSTLVSLSQLNSSFIFKSKKLSIGRHYYFYTKKHGEMPICNSQYFYCGNQELVIGQVSGVYAQLNKSSAFFTNVLAYRKSDFFSNALRNGPAPIVLNNYVYNYKVDTQSDPKVLRSGSVIDLLKHFSKRGFLSYNYDLNHNYYVKPVIPSDVISYIRSVYCFKDTKCVNVVNLHSENLVDGFSGFLPSVFGFLLSSEETSLLYSEITRLPISISYKSSVSLFKDLANIGTFFNVIYRTHSFDYLSGSSIVSESHDVLFSIKIKFELVYPSKEISSTFQGLDFYQFNNTNPSNKFHLYSLVNNNFDSTKLYITKDLSGNIRPIVQNTYDKSYIFKRITGTYLTISDNINQGLFYWFLTNVSRIRHGFSEFFSQHYGTNLLVFYGVSKGKSHGFYGEAVSSIPFSFKDYNDLNFKNYIKVRTISSSKYQDDYDFDQHTYCHNGDLFSSKSTSSVSFLDLDVFRSTIPSVLFSDVKQLNVFIDLLYEVGTMMHELIHGLATDEKFNLVISKNLTGDYQNLYFSDVKRSYLSVTNDFYEFLLSIRNKSVYCKHDYFANNVNHLVKFEAVLNALSANINSTSGIDVDYSSIIHSLTKDEISYLNNFISKISSVNDLTKLNEIDNFYTYSSFRDWNHNLGYDFFKSFYINSSLETLMSLLWRGDVIVDNFMIGLSGWNITPLLTEVISNGGYESTKGYRQRVYKIKGFDFTILDFQLKLFHAVKFCLDNYISNNGTSGSRRHPFFLGSRLNGLAVYQAPIKLVYNMSGDDYNIYYTDSYGNIWLRRNFLSNRFLEPSKAIRS